jgi:O-antigen/teichoic acid export membrane protein
MAQAITTSRRLIHNTLFNVATLVSNAVVGFFLIRFFLGQLGEVRYGVWVLVGSLFRYRGILSMGLNSAINRRIPMYLARDDLQSVQRVISTAFVFFSGLGGVLVLLTVLLCVKIGAWFEIPPDLVSPATGLVLVVGLCFAVSSPLQLTSAVLSGLQRYDITGAVTLTVLTVRTVLLVVLLLRGHGLLTMGLVFGFSEVAARALQYGAVGRLLPRVALSRSSVDGALLKDMLFYGVNTFMYTTGALIIAKASELVIGVFLGMAEVTRFAVAMAAVLLLTQFLHAFTAAIKPAVSDLDARDDHGRVRQIAFLTQKYSLLFIIPAGCFLVVMGREFLSVWVGEEFPDPAIVNSLATILAILAVGHCLMLAQHSNFLVLAGRGEHKVFGILTILTAVLCVSGSIVTVRVFGWGLNGIAWSNFVPLALVSGVILPIYFNRKTKISASESVANVWGPASLGSLPAIALMALWKQLRPPGNWAELLAVVVVAGAVTLVSAWFLSLDRTERRRLLAVLGRGPLPAMEDPEPPSTG